MRKRRRRVVAPPARLGPSQEGDLTALVPTSWTEPVAAGSGRPAEHEPAATSEPTLPDRAREDTDEAWGDAPEDDARMLRDKPPHWQ